MKNIKDKTQINIELGNIQLVGLRKDPISVPFEGDLKEYQLAKISYNGSLFSNIFYKHAKIRFKNNSDKKISITLNENARIKLIDNESFNLVKKDYCFNFLPTQ